jgi:hypothetical protein
MVFRNIDTFEFVEISGTRDMSYFWQRSYQNFLLILVYFGNSLTFILYLVGVVKISGTQYIQFHGSNLQRIFFFRGEKCEIVCSCGNRKNEV